MTIPLDNLYHFIQSLIDKQATFYLFYPHGSKKIRDLRVLDETFMHQGVTRPGVICHDQEPLNFELYQDHQPDIQQLRQEIKRNEKWQSDLPSDLNLAHAIWRWQGASIFDGPVLLHSEENSRDLAKYQRLGFIGAYFWSHALIAQDWYRFAKHDRALESHWQGQSPKFLIYSRGWINTREYRLKFIEMLIKGGLLNSCVISMLKRENDTLLRDYVMTDARYTVDDYSVFDAIADNHHTSDSSAGYDAKDIVSTTLSVVLETMFSDGRIQLTEKILRPIACAHPFLLAAGPHSLIYLRRYGFKTFHPLIDESYDQETDPVKRLGMLYQEMRRISNLRGQELRQWYRDIKNIADYNREHFYSDGFSIQVTQELKRNLGTAVEQSWTTRGKNYLHMRQRERSACEYFPTHLKDLNHVVRINALRYYRQVSSTGDQSTSGGL